jgi:hypothetical protein
MYEVENDDHDPDWVLGLSKQADCVILDIDNCPQNITALASYFIANTNTYWLTSGEQLFYNKISSNRIYNLDSIVHGGTTFEKE